MRTGMFSVSTSVQNSGDRHARHGSTTTLAAGSRPGKTFSLQVSTTSSPRSAMRRMRACASIIVTREDENASQMPKQMPQRVQASASMVGRPSSAKPIASCGQASAQRLQSAPRTRVQ